MFCKEARSKEDRFRKADDKRGIRLVTAAYSVLVAPGDSGASRELGLLVSIA